MKKDRQPMSVSPDEGNALLAWFHNVVRQLRLAWRLIRDQRVPLWTKFIPPVAVIYVLSPVDILPDLPPMGLNQLDDVAVLLLGVKLFIELSPPEVVREHLRALGARIEEWRVVDEASEAHSMVDGRYEIKGPDLQKGEEEET